MVETVRSKETLLGSKVDNNKKKSDFLKGIIMTIVSRRLLLNKVEN